MDQSKNILIFGEMNGDRLSSMTVQLMRVGKRLSEDLNQEMHLLLIGGKSQGAAEKGFGYGADKVYTVLNPLLGNYMTDTYLQAMEQVAYRLKPLIVLFGQNDRGLDLAPRLAFRLKTGVTLDCVDLKIDAETGLLEQVKPVFGGKAHSHYYCKGRYPQIASVRDGAFDPTDYDPSRSGEVEKINFSLDSAAVRTRFLRKEGAESLALALRLASANIVVCGGRGLKKKEGMELIQETANLLGGAIAGSRPAVDYGWVPSSLQVGLTGKKVNPQVYIAVGISGALQHMAGCRKSKTIVAINSDESAPIFRFAHIGVVGDYREVLEGFNNEFKKNR
ncbi:MAG: electron transfer flavoprotein subunit alpha/FixB family protein [Deltaproteobacteria bacterium]|nr:electron transfer flavoprotein subunit alpha/FixB family protein [Deltaproteobacteria bacterium]